MRAAQGWVVVREYRECESGGTARPAPSCRRCCAPRRSGASTWWCSGRWTG